MKIFIDETELTDKSKVYAVRITRFEDMPRSIDTLVIDAIDKESAKKMADEIYIAITAYSNEDCEDKYDD